MPQRSVRPRGLGQVVGRILDKGAEGVVNPEPQLEVVYFQARFDVHPQRLGPGALDRNPEWGYIGKARIKPPGKLVGAIGGIAADEGFGPGAGEG